MRDITAIGKDSRNQAQNFNFRGIDAIYNELHNLLAKHGIVTLPFAGTPVTEERTNKNGTILRFVQLPMTYQFTAEDGSSVNCHVVGEGMDSGDKATNKAMAIAHKYALLQTFLIPTEEQKDPDYESHEVAPKAIKVEKPKTLPENSLEMLQSMMWSDEIPDAHVIEFLIAKKAIKSRDVLLKDLDAKVVNRLVEKWDDVKAFKPIL